MAYLDRVNAKLKKAFGGRVRAQEERGCIVLTGELSGWDDIVCACGMAVNKKRYLGVVNDIRYTGSQPAPMRAPSLADAALEGASPDVLVIGGGVVGCAVIRELARYDVSILLVEKEHDLAMQASSRNDGMVHAGIDLKKGSRKYEYNMRGNRMYGDVCAELGVDFKRCGQYICFDKGWWRPLLCLSLPYWKWLGLTGVRALGKKKLREEEPAVSHSVRAALHFPSTGVVCPYNLTIAYAENAVQNGARVSLDTVVSSMEVKGGRIRSVSTNRGTVYPKVVVNAAGVFCEDVARMADDRFYSIHPRKGTNAILDKKYSDAIVRTAVSSIGTVSTKTAHSKGGGIIRTVDDNVLVGPDAVETPEKEDYSTVRDSVEGTIRRQGQTSPVLEGSRVITYFSGVRAPTYEEDFVVCKGKFTENIVHAAGIQSPGLTAAPAIGVDVARMAVELLGGEAVPLHAGFDPKRKATPRIARLPYEARAEMIAQNPDYGIIVCRCEEISRGEILDALRRNIPCDTLDGVKRRVRPGMGRCQGGFCGPLVLGLIAQEKGLRPEQVRKSGEGSEMLCGPTKGGRADD